MEEQFGWIGTTIKFVLDFSIAWIVVYSALGLIKANSRSIQIIKGVLMIYVLNVIASFFKMEILGVLTKDVITWGILGIIIVFQPEIRNGLEQLGRGRNFLRRDKTQASLNEVEQTVIAVERLSKSKTGALIVFEGKVGLDEYAETATPIQSVITSELIETIFFPNTPLHDGAMIIRKGEILCSGAILPSTSRTDLSQTVGTRHRAAIGVSELYDCLVVVVSEETGLISIAKNGEIQKFTKVFEFEKVFRDYLRPTEKNNPKNESKSEKMSKNVE